MLDNKIVGAVLIVAILIVGGYLFIGNSSAVVSAVGESVIDVEPDLVSIYLTVESRAKTAQEAKDLHDALMEELEIALLRAGLERKDIKTQSFNVYPEYDWSNGRQTQKGFVATQSIIVETSDFDSVPEIVDAGIDSGALISWINFELSKDRQNDYKVQALEEAGQDAKRKAGATASGLGKSLGKLVSVKSQDFNYGPVIYYAAESGVADAGAVKEAAVNLVPQDIEVRATIIVEYKLRAL